MTAVIGNKKLSLKKNAHTTGLNDKKRQPVTFIVDFTLVNAGWKYQHVHITTYSGSYRYL